MEVSRPYIVAGPCSVESHEQLAEVVQALERVPQVQMVRCGVWKPRTHPGGFEGMGEQALRWIAEQKAAHPAVRFCCEVARPEHVELAMRYGMDALWIGARTTANPFIVQEVTEALRGTEMRVMVKNAPSPDVQLWIGALERCRQVGLKELMAVHRGFDLYKNGDYRNRPLWEVPIELRRLEHVVVDRQPQLGQQITPAELEQVLKSLEVRQTDSTVADEQLRLLREQIDLLDSEMLRLLAARLEVVGKIAKVKERGNLAVYQPKRWEQLLRQRRQMAEDCGMNPDFVEELFEKVHAESVKVQLRN